MESMHPLEVELKFEVDRADLPRLAETALAGLVDRTTQQLDSTYHDTPDLALMKAGFGLRVRRGDRGFVQTVKAEGEAAGGLFVRPEWERPLPSPVPILDDASGPLVRTLGHETLAQVAPLFVTALTRISGRVNQDGSDIEVAIDSGEVRADAAVEPLCEIELELRDGLPPALFALARRIDEQVPLRLGLRSKAERGYALAAGADAASEAPDSFAVDPDGTAADAFRAIAQACIRRFRDNEVLLLAGGAPDPVHQARVALRRLRSAFKLFRPLFEGDAQADALRGELRWLAGLLGSVRDIDVTAARFDGEVGRQLAVARATAFATARETIAGRRARLLMIDLSEWLALGGWTQAAESAEARASDVRLFAATLLDKRRRRLKRRGADLAALDDPARHRVRIEAKTLRYATEFFASVYAGVHTGRAKARRRHGHFLDALKALQDALGDLNDIAAARGVLDRLGIAADLPDLARRSRKSLLADAEQALDDLLDTKRFWRD